MPKKQGRAQRRKQQHQAIVAALLGFAPGDRVRLVAPQLTMLPRHHVGATGTLVKAHSSSFGDQQRFYIQFDKEADNLPFTRAGQYYWVTINSIEHVL